MFTCKNLLSLTLETKLPVQHTKLPVQSYLYKVTCTKAGPAAPKKAMFLLPLASSVPPKKAKFLLVEG